MYLIHFHSKNNIKMYFPISWVFKEVVESVINIFLVISIVIDSGRGHCYVHLKKKIERVTCILMFAYVINF